ncbi:hypothetical protein C2I18_05935 [Paenibacillus sp. PK3_47]|uniref:VanZ family protein n=1 Tax=Paenibacillus sp. PK3_47 TaxID=2072642 RepID=UPI00201D9995|nr:VanZ family protein [Paenibacillus sp. PK3_47]UQZ33138.1 hypothetical protein C2I18_05935 [Paenibacillus sp. PK3_47]
MKVVLVLIWGFILFVFTCAGDSGFWSAGDLPYFHWKGTPDFHKMLLTDLKLTPGYIIRKIGHFSGFAILAGLILHMSKKVSVSLVLSVGYAIFTEVLQLYFGRDGRLYDVGIDSAGVLFGLLLAIGIRKIGSA